MSAGGERDSPLVTVLMPVYNGEAFVAAAVESILGQTFRDFELLVIDDGSTDRSVEIVERFDDPRIRIVHNDQQLELIRTLNRGLELARGKYVARMDADDISLPERLEQQVGFLESNPDVGICGTWVTTMGDREGDTWCSPETAENIRCRLLFDSPLAHPTVCIRRDLFVRHGLRFDEEYPHAEDYELWGRASDLFPLANISSALLRYRIHAGNVSHRHHEEQAATIERIHRERLARLGVSPTDEELRIHRSVADGGTAGEGRPLSETRSWLDKLLRANRAHEIYPKHAFERMLGQFWIAAAHRSIAAGRPAVREFFRSRLAFRVGAGECIRLLLHASKRSLRA